MNRIDRLFRDARSRGKKILIPFITAGDPDIGTTERLIPLIAAAGGDIIELGIPFSDPMADGPTIQRASERALASCTTVESILAMVKNVRRSTDIPIVLMGYYNPILCYGLERFAVDARGAGVDGVLVVDLPPEESRDLARHTRREGIHLIRLITPTTAGERIRQIAASAGGYLYYVSVTGVTGARNALPKDLSERMAAIRNETSIPVVVGFGIGTPEMAREAADSADGVVVGSALVRLFEEYRGDALEREVASFITSIRSSIPS